MINIDDHWGIVIARVSEQVESENDALMPSERE